MVLKLALRLLLGSILLLIAAPASGQRVSELHPISDADSTIARLKEHLPQAEYNTFIQLANLATKGLEYQQAGNHESAKRSYEQYLSLLQTHLSLTFAITNRDYSTEYWNVHLKFINHIITSAMLLHTMKEHHWEDLAYNCVLLSKNLFLESYTRLKSAVSQSNDQEIHKLWDICERFRYSYNINMTGIRIFEADSLFIAAKEALKSGQDHPVGNEVREVETFKQQVDSMRMEVLSDEELLSKCLCATDLLKNDFGATWSDVRNSLSPGEATIEFASYYHSSNPEDIKYAAILVRHDSEYPQIIGSFNELQLTMALLKGGSSFFQSLYDLIWQPFEKYLEGIDEIYLSTTGMIDRVPFHAIERDGKQLIQKYKINNLLSTKDVVKLKKEEKHTHPSGDEALFLGGADFGIVHQPSDTIHNPTRAQGADYLYQSKIEVVNSAKLLIEKGWVASVFTDEYASESQLKQSLAQSTPKILHIATHGFYLPPQTAKQFKPKMSDFRKSNWPLFEYNADPMMRCGLLLAGANRVWSGMQHIDLESDGILTGMEISLLNLCRTELVVISACYTGIGDVDYFEGTYGLLRAFKKAGANKLIVALWEIPDKESAEFMHVFYSTLRIGHNVTTSFRRAQRYMHQKYTTDPKKWAGFVLVE